MLNRWFKLMCLAASFTFIMACAGQKPAASRPSFTPVVLPTGEYAQKAESFIVILDDSESMSDAYKGTPKIEIAKELASRMNSTIPGLPFTAGLRTFGQGSCVSYQDTTLLYGMAPYSKTGFESAVDKVACTGGNTPMENGFEGVIDDLKSAPGKKAVVVFSDGIVLDRKPLGAAERLKAAYGDDICIYPVLVGANPGGKRLMDQIAKIGGCGFSVSGDDIYAPEAMADFVKKVLLTSAPQPAARPAPKTVKAPVDSDGDGVYDNLDKCPRTPKGVKVDKVGCPLDTDGDGVYDYLDKCPGTPQEAKVNSLGCWVLEGVHFDTGKSDIKPKYYPILDEVVAVLKKNPALKVEIQGHTDNRGSQEYNQRLSENRAKAVMEYFVNAGIDRNRLSAKGYGPARPAFPNTSPENMARNRRVELKPVY